MVRSSANIHSGRELVVEGQGEVARPGRRPRPAAGPAPISRTNSGAVTTTSDDHRPPARESPAGRRGTAAGRAECTARWPTASCRRRPSISSRSTGVDAPASPPAAPPPVARRRPPPAAARRWRTASRSGCRAGARPGSRRSRRRRAPMTALVSTKASRASAQDQPSRTTGDRRDQARPAPVSAPSVTASAAQHPCAVRRADVMETVCAERLPGVTGKPPGSAGQLSRPTPAADPCRPGSPAPQPGGRPVRSAGVIDLRRPPHVHCLPRRARPARRSSRSATWPHRCSPTVRPRPCSSP